MTEAELLTRLALALAIGLLIGVERGWQERTEAEGERTAGIRTFALIGLSGGIWAMLAPYLGPVAFAAAFAAVAAGITLFRWREVTHEGSHGATTLVAAYLTFALGAFAAVGDMTIAAAAAVTTTAILAAKPALHRWVAAVTWPELRATLVLLAMSLVALPLIPDADLGPYGAINPHDLWLMAIAIAAVSYVGYAAVKLLGDARGTVVAGLGAGLVSSTAATVEAARQARLKPDMLPVQLSAAAIASAVMFGRVLVIAGLFGQHLLPLLVAPLAGAALVMLAVAAISLRMGTFGDGGGPSTRLGNPLDLVSVLRFTAILAAIMIVARWAAAAFGEAGLTAVAAAAGLADVDAITLSVSQMPAQAVAATDAGRAIMVAVVANSVAKSALSFLVGGAMFGAGYAAATVAALAVGAGLALVGPASAAQ
jgi:uncharacterized membrane protein (DUF4010 family)